MRYGLGYSASEKQDGRIRGQEQVMKPLMIGILLCLTATALAAPSSQPSSTPSATPSIAQKSVDSIWSAFRGGRYREAIAGAIVLLMFLWRRFGSKLLVGKLGDWGLTFVTALFGLLGSLPASLTASPFSWQAFVINALLTSGEAILFYQVLGKKLLPKVMGDIPKVSIVLIVLLSGCATWPNTVRTALDTTGAVSYTAAVRAGSVCDKTVTDCMKLPAPKTALAPKSRDLATVSLIITGVVDLLQIVQRWFSPSVDTEKLRHDALERSQKALALFEGLGKAETAEVGKLAGRACPAYETCAAVRREVVRACVAVQAAVLSGYVAVDATDKTATTMALQRLAGLIRPITDALSAYGVKLDIPALPTI
jgi:hypothetical protein